MIRNETTRSPAASFVGSAFSFIRNISALALAPSLFAGYLFFGERAPALDRVHGVIYPIWVQSAVQYVSLREAIAYYSPGALLVVMVAITAVLVLAGYEPLSRERRMGTNDEQGLSPNVDNTEPAKIYRRNPAGLSEAGFAKVLGESRITAEDCSDDFVVPAGRQNGKLRFNGVSRHAERHVEDTADAAFGGFD